MIDWRHGPALSDYAATVPDLLAAARQRAGNACVLVEGDQRVTWPWLEQAAARIASALAPRVRPGDRVAIAFDNGLAHVLAQLAVWRLAAITVPIWPGLGEAIPAAMARSRCVLACAANPAAAPPGVPCLDRDELLRLAAHGPGLEQRPVSP